MKGDPPALFDLGPSVGPATVPDRVVEDAAALPPDLRLGTSSWTFPGWAGVVYDRRVSADVLAREGLQAYAQHPLLRGVGVDRTYYRPVDAPTFARWYDQVPAGFRFTVKAARDAVYPHSEQPARFLDVSWTVDHVVAPFVEGLQDKAGPLLFQFTSGAVGDPSSFPERLHAFLGGLPGGVRYAVEVRDRALLTRPYAQALRAVGASHVINVFPDMPTVQTQARVCQATGQRDLVLRWMLRPDRRYADAKEAWAPFDKVVEPHDAVLDDVTSVLAAHASTPTDVIVNNKAEGCSPGTLARIAMGLRRRLVRG